MRGAGRQMESHCPQAHQAQQGLGLATGQWLKGWREAAYLPLKGICRWFTQNCSYLISHHQLYKALENVVIWLGSWWSIKELVPHPKENGKNRGWGGPPATPSESQGKRERRDTASRVGGHQAEPRDCRLLGG